MNRFIPLAIIGLAAVAATVSAVQKRRQQKLDGESVTLEEVEGSVSDGFQRDFEAMKIEATSRLDEFTGDQVTLQHTIDFTLEDEFFEVVKALKNDGYQLDDVGNLSAQVSKSIERNATALRTEMDRVYALVTRNKGRYRTYVLTQN